MTERWRVLALMTTAQAGSSLVQQALGSLSPALVATFALSKAELGLAFTGLLVGATCCTAAAGAMTDRSGERKMLALSAIIMTFALVGAASFVNYIWLVAMMTLYGAGFAASTPAGGRAILAWFERDRGFAMGVRQTGVSVGGLVGAIAFPLIALHGGYRAAFAFAAVLVATTSAVACALYRETPAENTLRVTFAAVVRSMRPLLFDPRLVCVALTCMLLSACQFVLNAFLTVTAMSTVHASAHSAGLAMAVLFVAAICGRLGWGYVSDRYFGGDRFVPLGIICVLVAIGAVLLAALVPGSTLALFFAAALLGLSASGWNGLMAAALSEIGGVERAASALGLGLTAIFAASAVAPWAFGTIADYTSLRLAWVAVSIVALCAVFPMLWLHRRQTT